MATVVPRSQSPDGAAADHAHCHAYRLYVKGAAEVILDRSVKSAQRRRKHCALAVVRQSQKFSPRRTPPSWGRGTAKI